MNESAPLGVGDVEHMLVPHTVTDPVSALGALHRLILEQLEAPNWQWVVALASVGLGAAMLAIPVESFKYIVVALIFCIVYTISMGVIHDRFHGQDGLAWEPIVAVEFGLCAVLVAWKGFHGVEAIISVTIGIMPLWFVRGILVQLGIFGASPLWNVAVVTASFALGFWLDERHRFKQLVGYVLPLVGGKLVSASVGWALWHTWTKAWLDFFHSLPFDIADPAVAGMEQQLLGAPEVGWSTPQHMTPSWTGALAGALLWFVLAAASVWRQQQKFAEMKEEAQSLSEMLLGPDSVSHDPACDQHLRPSNWDGDTACDQPARKVSVEVSEHDIGTPTGERIHEARFALDDDVLAEEEDEDSSERKPSSLARKRMSTAMQHRDSWSGPSATELQARSATQVLLRPARRLCCGLSFIGAVAACGLPVLVLLQATRSCGIDLTDERFRASKLLVAMSLWAVYYLLYVLFWFGIYFCRCKWSSLPCRLSSVLDVLQTVVLWTYSCWVLLLDRAEEESCMPPVLEFGSLHITAYQILAGLLVWNLVDALFVMQLTYSNEEKELLWNAVTSGKPSSSDKPEQYEELPGGP